MMMADLARTMRARAVANNDGNDDDDNDAHDDAGNVNDDGLFGAGGLIEKNEAPSDESEALNVERQYFGLAHDMNEVLVSHIHDAAARGKENKDVRSILSCMFSR